MYVIAVTYLMLCVGVASELCAWYPSWLLHRSVGLQLVLVTSAAAWQKVQVILNSDNFFHRHRTFSSRPFWAITSYCCFSCYLTGTAMSKILFKKYFNYKLQIAIKNCIRVTITVSTLMLVTKYFCMGLSEFCAKKMKILHA